MERSQQQTMAIAFLSLVLVVTLAVGGAGAAAVRPRRDVSQSASVNLVKVCHSSTPCGWAVYIPFTRRVDYFMPNTCECPKGRSCIRADDDLSVSAYVYRCKETPSTTVRSTSSSS